MGSMRARLSNRRNADKNHRGYHADRVVHDECSTDQIDIPHLPRASHRLRENHALGSAGWESHLSGNNVATRPARHANTAPQNWQALSSVTNSPLAATIRCGLGFEMYSR